MTSKSWGPAAAHAIGTGAIGAAAFPLVIPQISPQPLLDGAPRELFILLLIGTLFRIANGRGSLRRQMALCGCVGIGFFAVLFYWLDIAIAQFGGVPQVVTLTLLAGLTSLCAAFWLPLPWLMRRFGGPLGFACSAVTLEWLRGHVLSFPWGQWGYSQARNLAWVQLASVGGVFLVSFFLAYLGAQLQLAIAQRSIRRLALCTIIAVLATAIGAWQGMDDDDADDGPGLRVGVVQGNIEQELKNQGKEHRDLIYSRYVGLSRDAVREGADWLIWPEGALPDYLRADAARLPLPPLGAPLLLGVGTYEQGTPVVVHNGALWADAQGDVRGHYAKQHLVPFGEYVPLRSILPIDKLVPGGVDFTAGTSPSPVGVPPAGVLICYDGVYPEIARSETLAGAKWLVNLTNDGWYGISSAPYQHRDFYVFRAVENRRWVARATNTGVSLFVDPYGHRLGETTLAQSGIALHTIHLRDDLTLYARWGDWLICLSLGAVLGRCLASIRRFW